jgi:formylglycine-generating enzyme required for sulfatase activity
VVADFRKAGLNVFFYKDVIKDGENIPIVIEQALQNSTYFILYCTKQSVASKWVKKEYEDFKKYRENNIKGLVFTLKGEVATNLETTLKKIDSYLVDIHYSVNSQAIVKIIVENFKKQVEEVNTKGIEMGEWQKILFTRNIENYKNYKENNPKSSFIGVCEKLITEIEKEDQKRHKDLEKKEEDIIHKANEQARKIIAEVSAKEQSSKKSQEIAKAWQETLKFHDIECYENYLKDNSDSPYREDCNNLIKGLEEAKNRLAASNNHLIKVRIDELEKQNNKAAEKIILAAKQTAEKQLKEARLVIENESVEKEKDWWITIKVHSNLDAYRHYLQLYPKGSYVEECEENMANLTKRKKQKELSIIGLMVLFILLFVCIFWWQQDANNTLRNIIVNKEKEQAEFETQKAIKVAYQTKVADSLREVVKGEIAKNMVWIVDGFFKSGKKRKDIVKLANFSIAAYEVSQREWRAFMGTNPSNFSYLNCDDCPVENISLKDIAMFIAKLSNASGKKYRLPNEWEWVCAAKGGAINQHSYSGGYEIDDFAYYYKNSENRPWYSRGKKPNGLEIYNMTGNVWEWVSHNPANNISRCYLYGGSFIEMPDNCRIDKPIDPSKGKKDMDSTLKSFHYGFRLACDN